MCEKFKKTAAILLLLFAGCTVFSETFRVRKVETLSIPGDSLKAQTAELKISDSLAVMLPEDRTFLEGIELSIQIPRIVADWRDSVAMSVYSDIKPFPSSSQIDYTGTKLTVLPLPAKISWIAQIPLTETMPQPRDNYISFLNIIPDTSSGYVFIRFQPAMKGVPDEVYDSTLTVSVKPVLKNKGMLKLSVKDLDGKNVSSENFIDDVPVTLKNGKILLDPGIHTLSVQNSSYRNEVRSIIIEQAKTTDVNLTLKSTEPALSISAPEGTQIFLDDKPFTRTNREIPISEGEHKIRFSLGGYEMTRAIEIQNGKTYKVNLTIDLEVTDE